jgi:hypothetical protein
MLSQAEHARAAEALWYWLRSQDLKLEDVPAVLVQVLCAAIVTLSRNQKQADKGVAIISKILRKTVARVGD